MRILGLGVSCECWLGGIECLGRVWVSEVSHLATGQTPFIPMIWLHVAVYFQIEINFIETNFIETASKLF